MQQAGHVQLVPHVRALAALQNLGQQAQGGAAHLGRLVPEHQLAAHVLDGRSMGHQLRWDLLEPASEDLKAFCLGIFELVADYRTFQESNEAFVVTDQ